MSWRERRRAASFRGVPFTTVKRDKTGGRRGPTHETPQRDHPDAEDTGARAPGFAVSALLIGEDYDVARDKLLAALDKPGPGIYIDPWGLGEQRVLVRQYRLTEDDKTGGLARFEIQFENAGDPTFPRAATLTPQAVETSAAGFSDAAVADFAARFDLAGRPQFVADAAQGHVDDLTRSLGRLAQGLSIDRASLVRDAVAAGSVNMTAALRGDLGSAVRDTMSAVAGEGFGGLGIPGDPVLVQGTFANMASFGAGWPAVPPVTATRQVQAANAGAFSSLVRTVAVATEARALARVAFDSVDQALELRDGVLGRLSAVADVAALALEDRSVAAAEALRAAVVEDVRVRSGGLPRRRTATVNDAMPSVVMAYRLYGDAAAADDLKGRNPDFRHPLFSPPSITYLE